ncbi:putative reverse transcriptase domain-containing protein [Tanacetum coccineum]
MQKVEYEKTKQDDALSDLSDILEELKEMAMDMGSEIGSHKDALSPLDEDVEELTTRVKGFKKINPVSNQSVTDLESGHEGFFPVVLVQILMCNEKELEAPDAAPQSPGQAPPSLDYVLGPEHPPSLDYLPSPEELEQAPLSPDHVPDPEYSEYLVSSDVEAPIEEQPLSDDASPTTLSSGYIVNSDPEEDPKEDHADYPTDGGDDADDESSDDDDDDDDEDQEASEDDDEDEEHPALAESYTIPADNPIPTAEDTEAFETDESAPTHVPSPRLRRAKMYGYIKNRKKTVKYGQARTRERKSVQKPEASVKEKSTSNLWKGSQLWKDSHGLILAYLFDKLELAAVKLNLSFCLAEASIPSPPLPLPSPPTTSPTYAEAPLGYRAAEIRLRAASPSTYHLSKIPSPPLLLPSTTHKYDLPEVDMPLWKRARFTAPTGRLEVGRVRQLLLLGRKSVPCLGRLATGLQTRGIRYSQIHVLLEDAQDDRALQRGRVNMLFKDRRFHHHTAMLLESEARHAREATSRNGDDNHDSRTGSRRIERVARMTWKSLMKMLTDKYFPRGEIKKLEIEIWNLKVKGTDVASYTQHFQELALMCGRMFPEESDQFEKYVGGLLDMIQGSVMASKPKTMQETIEIANDLMDQKIRTLAERQAKNKGKFEDTSRNNQNQQQPFKRHNVAQAYTAWPGEKKPSYPVAANNQRAQGTNQRVLTCFECGAQGHFKSNFPKLKNKNQGNQVGNGNAVARAYDVGTAGTNSNSNVVTGTFLLNNRYASILFDTGADRIFLSTAFSSLIDIIPTTQDHGYDVELADGRII